MLKGEGLCGTCKWHSCDGQDWVCVNYESEFCADWTDYDHTCPEWEERRPADPPK